MADDSETAIKIYLRQIMETPLLTAQQEIELAARIIPHHHNCGEAFVPCLCW
jgi:hypothetical protein